jgi:hypothetical protein
VASDGKSKGVARASPNPYKTVFGRERILHLDS